jgi:hypothetical protein
MLHLVFLSFGFHFHFTHLLFCLSVACHSMIYKDKVNYHFEMNLKVDLSRICALYNVELEGDAK